MPRKKRKKTISLFERFFKQKPIDTEFDEAFTEEDYTEEDYDSEIDDELFEDTKKGKKVIAREEEEDLRINLIDAGDTLTAQAIVPGLDEKDITIDLTREMITITTNSNEQYMERNGDYLYEELSFGSFSRSVLLPAEVEVEEASAEVKDGLLTVVMPKINKAAKKKLSVKRG